MSDPETLDLGTYCREVESYLCRRNGGHLVRIVGPAFDMVGSWATRGVPLKVVFRGIDRVVERRTRRGGARRPIRIEFCEADVLDVFNEWRRAVGVLAPSTPASVAREDEEVAPPAAGPSRGPSFPAHIERVQLRLSSALATERLEAEMHRLLEEILTELSAMQEAARTARGPVRRGLLDQLRVLDLRLGEGAWTQQGPALQAELRHDAARELAAFRNRMPDPAWREAIEAAARRLLRERLGLPVLALD